MVTIDRSPIAAPQRELAKIEDALDVLLVAIEASGPPPSSEPLHVVSASEWHGQPVPTRREADIAALLLLRNPVGAALRQAIRRLGERLFEAGGTTGAMLETCNRVAARSSAHQGRRLSIMDHAWNGLGRDGDRWWT